jgi:hypothetical protein
MVLGDTIRSYIKANPEKPLKQIREKPRGGKKVGHVKREKSETLHFRCFPKHTKILNDLLVSCGEDISLSDICRYALDIIYKAVMDDAGNLRLDIVEDLKASMGGEDGVIDRGCKPLSQRKMAWVGYKEADKQPTPCKPKRCFRNGIRTCIAVHYRLRPDKWKMIIYLGKYCGLAMSDIGRCSIDILERTAFDGNGYVRPEVIKEMREWIIGSARVVQPNRRRSLYPQEAAGQGQTGAEAKPAAKPVYEQEGTVCHGGTMGNHEGPAFESGAQTINTMAPVNSERLSRLYGDIRREITRRRGGDNDSYVSMDALQEMAAAVIDGTEYKAIGVDWAACTDAEFVEACVGLYRRLDKRAFNKRRKRNECGLSEGLTTLLSSRKYRDEDVVQS